MDTPWQIQMLGRLRAVQGETDCSEGARVVARFRTRKAASLLAYLAYHPHRAHPRELLVELLWPECSPEHGHNNLSRELTSLRRQFEPRSVDSQSLMVDGPSKAVSAQPSTINDQPSTIILADRRTVQLSPAVVSADVAVFEAALQAARRAERGPERTRRLATAAALYQGELLPGSAEAWVVPERLRLAEAFLDAVHELVAEREEAGDRAGALQWAWRAAAVDPGREATHADLVRLLIATGQGQAAARRCRERERFLAQDTRDREGSAADARPSVRERVTEQSLRIHAAEAEALRRQLARQTVEAEALRQRLCREMVETRRLRRQLAERAREGERPEWPMEPGDRRVPSGGGSE